MKSNIKKILSIALAVPLMMFAVVGVAGSVGGVDPPENGDGGGSFTTAECDPALGIAGGLGCVKTDDMIDEIDGDGGIIHTIINVMLYIIGILSVIMIIWGGITYTTSRGKDDKVKTAKNTILYSVVGLVVAMVSWAIVNWVFTSIGGN